MSSIFSELVADILLKECGAATDSEKHLVGSVLGVPAAELYAAVASRAEESYAVKTGPDGDDVWEMRAIVLDNGVTVLPYLVLNGVGAAETSDPNRGNRGFNGRLRDWFDRGIQPGEIRVLLTFDEDPIETQRTAMDSGLQAALTAPALLRFAGLHAIDTAARSVAPLLDELITYVSKRADLAAEEVTQSVHALRNAAQAPTPEKFGETLAGFPWLLRDPDIEAGTARTRLGWAAGHRERIDAWAHAPTDDFEEQVRARYERELADGLIQSRRLGQVDWTRFTLAELQEGLRQPGPGEPETTRNRLSPSLPVQLTGSPTQRFKLVEDAGQPRYGVVALAAPGPIDVTVRLERPLVERETLHAFGYSRQGDSFVRLPPTRVTAAEASDDCEIRLTLKAEPLQAQWSCFELVLTEGSTYVKNYLGKADLALLLRPDLGELPYEADCTIDATVQRFVAPDEASIEIVLPDGTLRAPPDGTVIGQQEGPADVDDLVVQIGSQEIVVPVRYQVPEEEPPEAGAGEHSPEHALLRFAAEEHETLAAAGPPRLAFLHGRATATIAGRERVLTDIPELGRSRWEVESSILSRPDLTNYSLSADGGVDEDARLSQLEMSSALEPAFREFMDTRKAFFDAVLQGCSGQVPTTILALDLASVSEAEQYIAAYAALLENVPDGVNWQSEYERLLLVDSVTVAEAPGVYVAPTSPLAVAHHLEVQRMVAQADDRPVDNLLAADPDLISPRFALPMLYVDGRWHESRLTAYPWRLYSPWQQETDDYPEPFIPGFVARRVKEFLEVHPVYRDHRRTLTLAFVNPGGGHHIRQALTEILRAATRSARTDELHTVPQFEVKLLTGSESATESEVSRLGSDLDSFMTEAEETGAPTWLDQELMRRLTYTKGRLSAYVSESAAAADAAAFAHLAFIHNYFRPGALEVYELNGRASSAYAGGIAPDLERAAEIQANDISFSSGVWLGNPTEPTRLLKIVARSAEVAAASGGSPVLPGSARGVVTRVQKQTIPAIYERAVWVVHLDRHIGLELFYPQDGTGEGTPYILDHTDQENVQESGFDAITATSMVRPYLALIEAIFSPLIPEMDTQRARRLLRWLNVLSGRWALRLLRESPTAVKERLGAVIAFQMLVQRERIFAAEDSCNLVISLDELLRVTGKEGLEQSKGWAAQLGHKGGASDDLLVLHIPLAFEEEPTVYARVVEVKYSEGAASADKAWEQINETQSLLDRLFGTQGPGRPFRGRVLSKLMRTYLSRVAAYGLVRREAETDPGLIRALDEIGSGNYRFATTFTRDGTSLIGDFISIEPNYEEALYQAPAFGSGTDPGRVAGRIRIGRPLIQALIAEHPREVDAGAYSPPDYGPPAAGAEPPSEPEAGQPAEIPEPEVPEEQREERVLSEEDAAESQKELAGRFAVPPAEIRRVADQLDQIFARYQLPVQPFQPSLAEAGPNVIRFRTRMLEAGTIGSIEARTRDIHRELGIEDPVYIGQEPPYVVVDVPRPERATITFSDVLPVLSAQDRDPGVLPIVMGVDASGHVQLADLAQLPHLLVAGSTGSGKSVFLSTIGACLGLLPEARVELVVVDIKGLDLMAFAELPHTREGRVIEAPDEAVAVLEGLMTEEVARRKEIFRGSQARNIVEHYERAPEDGWPRQTVVIIDEYAQLVTAAGTTRTALERLVQQYAQFARAFGIYLVLATQRPSVDVITGRIKANLPARCVFRLPSFNDSRTVIDTGGAEKLLGSGDMLFYRDGALQRLQAIYTQPDDLRRIADQGA